MDSYGLNEACSRILYVHALRRLRAQPKKKMRQLLLIQLLLLLQEDDGKEEEEEEENVLSYVFERHKRAASCVIENGESPQCSGATDC